MASSGMAPTSVIGKPTSNATFVDKLPEEINEMKIKDEKVEKVYPHKSLYDVLSFFGTRFFFTYQMFCVLGNGSDSGGWKWN